LQTCVGDNSGSGVFVKFKTLDDELPATEVDICVRDVNLNTMKDNHGKALEQSTVLLDCELRLWLGIANPQWSGLQLRALSAVVYAKAVTPKKATQKRSSEQQVSPKRIRMMKKLRLAGASLLPPSPVATVVLSDSDDDDMASSIRLECEDEVCPM
jgi:hypothetical protein